MAGEKLQSVTIESLLQSGAIVGHKDGNHGSQYPSVEEFGSVGVPFLTAKSLSDGKVDIEHAPRLADEKANALRHGFVQPGDVLLSHNATVGRVAVVPEFTGRVLIGTSLTYFRVDRTRILPRYLAACFAGLDFQNQLAAVMSQSTRNQVPITAQRGLRVVIPSLAVQRAIAHILGTLDDKIELNRRMNETLEAMARALFQSWFVDFDPVRAKAEGRGAGLPKEIADLFPDRFEDSELGEIPAGWRIRTIGDIALRVAMGPFGSRITRDNFVPSGVPVVRGNNLADGFHDADFVFLTERKAEELKSAIASPGDLVFTHRGTLGQVGMIPTLAKHPRYVVSQSQMLLSVDRSKASPQLVYQFFRSERGQAALLANTSTTGVPAIARPTTSLKAIRIVVPPKQVSDRFEARVEPLALRRERSVHEVETLAALRDTLLPKLISGELRVNDAERFVARADEVARA